MTQGNSFTHFLEKWRPKIEKTLEESIGRIADFSRLERFFSPPIFEFDLEIIQKSLWDPFWDFMDRGGKRWRPALLLLSAGMVGNYSNSILEEKILPFAIIPEVIHNGTIIIDDVEDDSKTRRNKPCLHLLFGVDTAINIGNWLYFLPMTIVHESYKSQTISTSTFLQMCQIYQEDMMNVHLGQGTDIGWHRGNSEVPSEAQYLQMCLNKTGCLARMAAKLGAAIAGGTPEQIRELGHYAANVGVAFQIRDDILNLRPPDENTWTKDIGEDITEGKRTVMILHLLSQVSETQKQGILDTLNAHTEDQEAIHEIIDLMTVHGSFQYAEKVAIELIQSAWTRLDQLLPSSSFKEILKSFSEYVVDRDL